MLRAVISILRENLFVANLGFQKDVELTINGTYVFKEGSVSNHFLSFPKGHILDSSKLKGFADDKFKFDENCRKFTK